MPTALEKKMEKMVGMCTSCGVDIFEFQSGKKPRPLANYAEHLLGLSNDSVMSVGVCKDCKDVLTSGTKEADNMAEKILKHHKIWWEKNLPETERPKFHQDIFVTDTATTEKDFRQKLAKINNEKRLTREWQAEKQKGGKILDAGGNPIEESFEEFKIRKQK